MLLFVCITLAFVYLFAMLYWICALAFTAAPELISLLSNLCGRILQIQKLKTEPIWLRYGGKGLNELPSNSEGPTLYLSPEAGHGHSELVQLHCQMRRNVV